MEIIIIEFLWIIMAATFVLPYLSCCAQMGVSPSILECLRFFITGPFMLLGAVIKATKELVERDWSERNGKTSS